MDLPALGEENLAKDLEENDKKWKILLCWVGEREREKSWKNFWKSVLNESNTVFKKNMIHDVQLIEKQFQLDEILEKLVFWKTKQNNAETPQCIEFYESHA